MTTRTCASTTWWTSTEDSLTDSSSITPNVLAIPFACTLRYNACFTSHPSAKGGGPRQTIDACLTLAYNGADVLAKGNVHDARN